MKKINSKQTVQLILTFVVLTSLMACDAMTDFSPYDANVSYRNVNAQNITRIEESIQAQSSDSIVFIAISDTHTDYSELKAAVNSINEMDGISFVVVCGDITDFGLNSEFDEYYQLARRLKVPFITLIGNHDYLSNGRTIYNKMFGPTNFLFDIGNYRMVIFDNVVWENGNNEPDFAWLQEALQVPEGMTSIACFHIHPWDPQLENGHADRMTSIIGENQVSLSIFGHGHGYRSEEINNRRYLMIPDITKRAMFRICLKNKMASTKILTF